MILVLMLLFPVWTSQRKYSSLGCGWLGGSLNEEGHLLRCELAVIESTASQCFVYSGKSEDISPL